MQRAKPSTLRSHSRKSAPQPRHRLSPANENYTVLLASTMTISRPPGNGVFCIAVGHGKQDRDKRDNDEARDI